MLSAGPIQVRKDYRMTLVEAASLQIRSVDVSDTGKHCFTIQFGTVGIIQMKLMGEKSNGNHQQHYLLHL